MPDCLYDDDHVEDLLVADSQSMGSEMMMTMWEIYWWPQHLCLILHTCSHKKSHGSPTNRSTISGLNNMALVREDTFYRKIAPPTLYFFVDMARNL